MAESTIKLDISGEVEQFENLKTLLGSCADHAERLAKAAEGISPEMLNMSQGYPANPFADDMRTAVSIAGQEDHVTALAGKIWLKAMIVERCAMVGIADPFAKWKEPVSSGTETETKLEITGSLVNLEFVEAGHGHMRVNKDIKTTEQNDSSKLDLPCSEKQQADAWFKVCDMLNELVPGWSKHSKPLVECALDAIASLAYKESAERNEVNPSAAKAVQALIDGLSSEEVITAFNDAFGLKLAIPGKPAVLEPVKPDLHLAGFQWKNKHGDWSNPGVDMKPSDYEKNGFQTRFVYADEK